MLRLAGTYKSHRFVLPVGPRPLTLGSDSRRSDITLDAPGVSRRHARLERTETGVAFFDLGSKNGLWAGGIKHERIELQPGDRVRIGVLWLTLEEVSTSDHELASLPLPPAAPATQTELEYTAKSSENTLPELLAALRRLASEALDGPALDDLRRALRLQTLSVFRRSSTDGWLLEATAGVEALDLWPGDSRSDGALGPVGDSSAVVGKGDHTELDRRFVEEALATLLAFLERSESKPPRARHHADFELVVPEGQLTGSSPAARAMFEDLAAAIRSGLNVLLRGESGVGKESLAQRVHDSGAHAAGRFVALNCPAIPSALFESVLFGIEAGIATGVSKHPGLLQEAAGGTLFLDEVGDLPLEQQAKLLRALQEKVIQPVGSRSNGRAVNFRVVSATNRDLAGAIADGLFRADLYYRLAGFTVRVPSLRERQEDIPALAAHFAQQAAIAQRKSLGGISRKALDRLQHHDWPGNVRELQFVLARAVAFVDSGDALRSLHIERALSDSGLPAQPTTSARSAAQSRTLAEQVEACQRSAALEALNAERGNRTRAAERLGLTRNGLLALLKRLGLAES